MRLFATMTNSERTALEHVFELIGTGNTRHAMIELRQVLDDAVVGELGAALTGFTGRMAKALSHLRDAWISADAEHARTIEEALSVFARSHSMRSQRRSMETILGDTLMERIGASSAGFLPSSD